MISPFSVNNRYRFDSNSNIFLQPVDHWKDGVFYQKFPIYTKNTKNTIHPSPVSSPNLFRALPLKIFRNELAGNEIYNSSGVKNTIHTNSSILSHSARPGSYVFSKENPSDTNPLTLNHRTVVDSQTVIIGNSTNTVDGGCTSFEDRMNSKVQIFPRSWDSECLCKDASENKTYCFTRPKSQYLEKNVYIEKTKKPVCLTTAGNALTRVRNRGAFNCGGGSGNIGYRPQYSSTKKVISLVSNLNNYGNYRNI
jgi:hypothetical protein